MNKLFHTDRSIKNLKKLPLFGLLLFSLILPGCNGGAGKGDKASTDLMTTRTLGLAYLEEFKLEEAEKQFLRFIDMSPKDKFGYANLGLTYLRMGKYREAGKQLIKAIEIDSTDADTRLILATVYKMDDDPGMSVRVLEKTLAFSPSHIKSLYEISEILSSGQDSSSAGKRLNYLKRLCNAAPGNLVPRLELTGMLIKKEDFDGALEQLEMIRQQFPEFPAESEEYFIKAINALRKKDGINAQLQFTIFNNYLKVTPPYQAGIMELKGPGGSLIGFPLITIDRKQLPEPMENEAFAKSIRFTDATASAGLTISPGMGPVLYAHAEPADFDADGDIDIYASFTDGVSSEHFLFSNNAGKFTDLSLQAGLNHKGVEFSAKSGDFDNDGFIDLFVMRNEGDILYRNSANGTFTVVTENPRAGSNGGEMALFLDADHDGDLDIFEISKGENLLFRNNSDNTFIETGKKSGLYEETKGSTDAAFADFDDDGDIDLFVSNGRGRNMLFSNQRQSTFRNIAVEAGLVTEQGPSSVCVCDYNNDGLLDIFTLSADGHHTLFRNTGSGKFEAEKNASGIPDLSAILKANDAVFSDFDNDGLNDLFITGESIPPAKRNQLLFHNEGEGRFTDFSGLLPEDSRPGKQVNVFDYNDDGDQDLLITLSSGGLQLLRNDGGNGNHFVKIKLVGLRAGSAKNNHFGIGAKVEMRAGDLYQTRVVTEPDIMFGIGRHSSADIVRITWTNGVPQNIFSPAADQSMIEAQTLKGSCPFLYTWNGKEYIFVKDILWRSGLGMPLGIMGGTTAYAFADASDDYLRIPGEMLSPVNGTYKMQVTSELWETIYLDKLSLVAVDHPDTTDIFTPEQFTPPPFPGMEIFHIGKKIPPVSAVDGYGEDVLPLITRKDDNYISSFMTDKYQGVTEMHDLILDPGKAGEAGKLYLFMNGWIFPSDASINVAISQSERLSVIAPRVQVINKAGQWETVISGLGFPMGKDKTVIADLSGKFLSNDHRIRIVTNMQIYWDWVFFSDRKQASIVVYEMKPSFADLHYRGFSATFRKGGRYGPHWFDYNTVTHDPKWRDLEGNYTKYGDVLQLLDSADNMYIISNAGDETTISFDQRSLPELKKGWKRDFLINSVGWVKDGDINTAFGNTVLPLPFHGMKSYPPSSTDRYPEDPSLARYNSEYNTRTVGYAPFSHALRK